MPLPLFLHSANKPEGGERSKRSFEWKPEEFDEKLKEIAPATPIVPATPPTYDFLNSPYEGTPSPAPRQGIPIRRTLTKAKSYGSLAKKASTTSLSGLTNRLKGRSSSASLRELAEKEKEKEKEAGEEAGEEVEKERKAPVGLGIQLPKFKKGGFDPKPTVAALRVMPIEEARAVFDRFASDVNVFRRFVEEGKESAEGPLAPFGVRLASKRK